MNWKSILKDMLSVCVVASILGLAYNFYSEHTLPLFHQDKKIDFIKENDIFGKTTPIDTANTHTITAENAEKVIDSLKNPAKPIIDSARKKEDNNAVEIAPKSHFINRKMLKKYMFDPRVILIDARSPEVYAGGHIGKAKNIFPLDEDRDKYLSTLMQLDREKTIIIYCDGGNCDLSEHIFNDLKTFEFSKVFIFQGGWEEWINNESHK